MGFPIPQALTSGEGRGSRMEDAFGDRAVYLISVQLMDVRTNVPTVLLKGIPRTAEI